MAIIPESLPERIRQIQVSTPEGPAGELLHDSRFRFSYHQDGAAIALSMPWRSERYSHGAIHPVFEMNLPEGFVRHYISERLRRFTRVDDMLFLALQGTSGIGRLSYDAALETQASPRETLEEILHWQGKNSLFTELLERHLFSTTVSGMQPKVAITGAPGQRATFAESHYIAKTSGDDYPQLPLNEYTCMRLARAAGLSTPRFWLSDDQTLFVTERFDITAEQRLGMEDFCVLMGRSGKERYLGSYENAAKVIATYGGSFDELVRLFDYLAFSCLVGNGDAHLKNFALLYEKPDTTPWLSPVYDVVCTLVYSDEPDTLALKMNRSKQFPDLAGLLHFANRLGIKKARQRLDAMATALLSELDNIDELEGFPLLKQVLVKQVDRSLALNGTRRDYLPGYDSHNRRPAK